MKIPQQLFSAVVEGDYAVLLLPSTLFILASGVGACAGTVFVVSTPVHGKTGRHRRRGAQAVHTAVNSAFFV